MDQLPIGQLHRLSSISTPIVKRKEQVEFPVYYHLINTYIVSLVQNTKLDDQQKQDRMSEFGQKLGSNVMEIIAAVAFEKIKLNIGANLKQGKYTEYIKFLGKDFWIYLFGQKVSKVQMSRTGNCFYEVEDRFEEQRKGQDILFLPGFQMTRRTSTEDQKLLEKYLSLWAKIVQGLVIGGMKTLGVECEVEAHFLQNQSADLKFTVSIIDPNATNAMTQSQSQSMNSSQSTTTFQRESLFQKGGVNETNDYKF